MTLYDRDWKVHLLTRQNHAFILLVGLVACGGCDKSNKGYVSGTVTMNGKPAGPGTIQFFPTDSAEKFPHTPIGSIGEDGHYELVVTRSEKGLTPGEYEVTIADAATASGLPPKPGAVAIPAKFGNRKESKLTASVKPGTQTFDFTLEP